MNTHLKQLTKGIIILLWMFVYWITINFIPDLFRLFMEINYDKIYYTTIVLSFYFFFLLFYYYYKKIEVKSLSSVFLLNLPYQLFLLMLQFSMVNLPRLIDGAILIMGSLFLHFFVFNPINKFLKYTVFSVYIIGTGVLYHIVYNNIWYYVHKNDLTENNALNEFNLKITNPDGISYNLSEFKEKTVFVDMWASSCGNCISEMPDFELLNKKFKVNKDYKIISLYCPISKEQTYEWFKSYINRKFKYDIDYYYIDYESFQKLNIQEFPQFLIINKSNHLIYKGPITYLPYIKDNIYNKLKLINENY